MLAPPEGVDDRDVVAALAESWGLHAEVEYAAVGFGSYHWIATDPDGDRRFVTVDDINGGRLPALTRAFDTALALRRAGLAFVVAPLAASDGASVRRLDDRYSITMLPFVDGVAGAFGELMDKEARVDVLGVLIDLHRATDVVREAAPTFDIALPGRHHIDAALGALADPWTGGPYSEPARAWLVEHTADVVALLETFDGLAARVDAARATRVITHGEPHPGNFIHTTDGLALVDWDTVGLAIPERDLWLVADDDDERARYAEATGHRPDESALALYALRWQLDDIAIFLDLLRWPHTENADTEKSWLSLDRARRIALRC